MSMASVRSEYLKWIGQLNWAFGCLASFESRPKSSSGADVDRVVKSYDLVLSGQQLGQDIIKHRQLAAHPHCSGHGMLRKQIL